MRILNAESLLLHDVTSDPVRAGKITTRAIGRTVTSSEDISPNAFRLSRVERPAKPPQLFQKRAIDIGGAGCGLFIMAPVLLLLALLIKLESPGPVLFRQVRTGLNGRPFAILKFRSMRSDQCDASGVSQTSSDDPRVTGVGRVLRRTNLDEVPQLWNVLVGDMSLVGPRPHVPDMLAAGMRYDDLVLGYEARNLVRPGLTGLAQSRGLRGPTDNRWKAIRRVICDVQYVRNFSLALDMQILLRTLVNEIRGGTGS